jgi:hypothetical protein
VIEDTLSLHKGMNNRDNSEFLDATTAVKLDGVETYQPGNIQRSFGVTQLFTPTSASEGFGLGLWLPRGDVPGAERRMIGYWEGNADGIRLWSTQGDGSWAAFDTGVSLMPTLTQFVMGRSTYAPSAGADSGSTAYVSTLFIASAAPVDSGGSFPYSGLAWRHDITSETDRASQTVDVRPRCALWWQGRLWAANSASTAHGIDWLGWSTIWDGLSGWTASNQNIRIDPDGGEEITGLWPIRGSNNDLYIFKNRSIWQLTVFWDTDGWYTESVDTIDTTESKLRKVATDVGCIATRSVREVQLRDGKSDIFFLAHDGIRSMRRAEQDATAGAGPPISEAVQALIDRINWDYAYKAVATTHKNFYILCVPVDGSIVNNAAILFDTFNGGWTTRENVKLSDILNGPLTTSERRTYGISSALFSESGYTGYHMYRLFTGQQDFGGSAVPMTVETRAFTAQQPSFLKRWAFVEIGLANVDTAATITVEYSVDDSNWATLGYFGFTASGERWPSLPFDLPWSTTDPTVEHRAISLYGIKPGRKLEIRLSDSESYAPYFIRKINVGSKIYPRYYRGVGAV